MFCSNCGNQIVAGASFCASCGNPVPAAGQAAPQAQYSPNYGQGYVPVKSKTTAGVLGILLGGLGIHKFYMGKIGSGILYLVLTLTIIFWWVPAIAGLVEGIVYLSQDEESFQRNVNNGQFF